MNEDYESNTILPLETTPLCSSMPALYKPIGGYRYDENAYKLRQQYVICQSGVWRWVNIGFVLLLTAAALLMFFLGPSAGNMFTMLSDHENVNVEGDYSRAWLSLAFFVCLIIPYTLDVFFHQTMMINYLSKRIYMSFYIGGVLLSFAMGLFYYEVYCLRSIYAFLFLALVNLIPCVHFFISEVQGGALADPERFNDIDRSNLITALVGLVVKMAVHVILLIMHEVPTTGIVVVVLLFVLCLIYTVVHGAHLLRYAFRSPVFMRWVQFAFHVILCGIFIYGQFQLDQCEAEVI